jgi:hypothetical protein
LFSGGYFCTAWHGDELCPAVRLDQCIAGILSDKNPFVGKEKGLWYYLLVDFVLLIMTALLFLLKVGSNYSRGSVLVFGLSGLPLLLGTRVLVCKELNKLLVTGLLSGPRCILIGDQEELRELSASEALRNFGVREANNPQQSWGFEGEPPEAVIKDFRTNGTS